MSVKRRDLRAALQILVDSGWFLSVPYSKKVSMPGGKIDYTYALTATEIFVGEVIKANAKRKGLRTLDSEMAENPQYVLPKGHGTLL